MADSFMSGMVSGFMDTAGAGMAGGAGGDAAGAASATGAADTGASSISAASASDGSQMAATPAASSGKSGGGGMMGGSGGPMSMLGGGGGSSAPPPSGAGAAGQVAPSTNLASNPANANQPNTSQYIQKAIQGYQKGSQQSPHQNQQGQIIMPNNTYSALFGAATQPGNYGGGQIGVQTPPAQPMQNAVTMPVAPPPQIAPPPPPPPSPMTSVSDVRAKYKIQSKQKARDELDSFLQNVYNNVTKRKS